MPSTTSQRNRNVHGFSLVELLVVVAVISVLAALVVPALNKGKQKAQGLQCLSNHRQLVQAWIMYVQDSRDHLPYASSTSSQWTGSEIDKRTWVTGSLDFNPANTSNWDPDMDIHRSPLWTYSRNLSVWKCPSDHSFVTVNKVDRPRVRSMSMNLYLGGWGGGDGGWKGYVSDFVIYRKYNELVRPGYSTIFVFLDMRQDSVDMGNFAVNMAGYPDNGKLYQFWDLPGFYHHRACGFSFADGHSEMKRWQDNRTTPPLKQTTLVNDRFQSPFNPDINWLQFHATRPRKK